MLNSNANCAKRLCAETRGAEVLQNPQRGAEIQCENPMLKSNANGAKPLRAETRGAAALQNPQRGAEIQC